MSERRVFEGIVRREDEPHDGCYLDDGSEICPDIYALFNGFIDQAVRITVEALNKCEGCGKWTPNGRTSMGQICDSCHYAVAMGSEQMSDAGNESMDEYVKLCGGFWTKYNEASKDYPHVCDIPLDDLEKRHHNVRRLLIDHPGWANSLANLVAGDYYRDVWGSRSCSEHLGSIFGLDYLDLYCSSDSYMWLRSLDGIVKDELLTSYEAARKLDDEVRQEPERIANWSRLEEAVSK